MMNTATAVTADRIYQEIDGRIQSRPAMPNLPSSPQFFRWLNIQAARKPVYNMEIAEDRAWTAILFLLPPMLFAYKVVKQSDLKSAFKNVQTMAGKFLDFMPNVPENTPEMEKAKGIVTAFTDRVQVGGMQHPITVLNALSRIFQDRMRKDVLKFKSEATRKELIRKMTDAIFELNEEYAKHYQYRESYERKGKTISAEFIGKEEQK